jgi:hypothetical protein
MYVCIHEVYVHVCVHVCVCARARVCIHTRISKHIHRGTGRDGRVLKGDVIQFLEETKSGGSPAARPDASSSSGTSSPRTSGSVAIKMQSTGDYVEPVRGYMRTMIKTMQVLYICTCVCMYVYTYVSMHN